MKSDLLQISIPLLIVAMVLFSIMSARVKAMKKAKKKTLLYVLLGGLIFGLLGFIGFLEIYIPFYLVFIVSGVYMLGMGILNAFTARQILPWFNECSFLWGFLFNVILAAFGTIFYLYIYFYLTNMGVNAFHLFNIPLFFVPYLIIKSVDYYLNIPKSEYKKWFYPFGKEIHDPTENEMDSPLVIAFVFQKKFDNDEITTFRAKAPKFMAFGKLFYYFIDDYNTKHKESKIEYIYERSKTFGWVFYIKPRFFGRRAYIDPDKTVEENFIEENSVIIAQRVF